MRNCEFSDICAFSSNPVYSYSEVWKAMKLCIVRWMRQLTKTHNPLQVIATEGAGGISHKNYQYT